MVNVWTSSLAKINIKSYRKTNLDQYTIITVVSASVALVTCLMCSMCALLST